MLSIFCAVSASMPRPLSSTENQTQPSSIQPRTTIRPRSPVFGSIPWVMAFSTRGCRIRFRDSQDKISGSVMIS